MYHNNASGCQPTSAPATGSSSSAVLEGDSTDSRTRPASSQRLSDRHYQHCCGTDLSQQQRNLDPRWIAANCYSLDAKQAQEILGYRAQSGGIALEGANGQFQFRPDRPWRTSEDKQKKRKAAKYLTPAGDEYDAFLPRHPDNPHYWLDLEALKQSCWQIDVADLEQFYLDLELEHNCSIAKDKAYDLAVRCAKQNPYHPVKDYLNHVANTVVPLDIKNLSQRYFGTLDPIYNEMMYRHLIGSVARMFHPGCKKDEAVILKGAQGILKSTFWQTLYGEQFFSDSLKGTDRDNLLILHQYWALELAEFETITSKKQAGDLKAFLSASVDTFREPYGRQTKSRKRQSAIVGSVNPDSFLVDETGNRRYWVIPVEVGRIDVARLAAERDGIWAAVVAAYRQGEHWHLSEESEQKISQLNNDYCHCDSWEVPVSNYLISRSMVTTFEILTNALDFEKARISKRDEMRVANILRSLGWQKTVATYLGKRQRVWMKGNSPDEPFGNSPDEPFGHVPSNSPGDLPSAPPTLPDTTLKREVDRPSNSGQVKDLDLSDPPDPPNFQTLLTDSQHQGGDDDLSPSQCFGFEVVSGGAPQVESLQDETSEAIYSLVQPQIHLSEGNQVDRPDYSTYPHLTSQDIRAQEKRANHCKESMLACTNKEELAQFRQESGFSPTEIDWVYRYGLTPSEREKVKEAAAAEQLNLFDSISYEWKEVLAAIDAELNRLGWTTEQAQSYLTSTYGVKSRHQLTDEQVIEFWHFLKGLSARVGVPATPT